MTTGTITTRETEDSLILQEKEEGDTEDTEDTEEDILSSRQTDRGTGEDVEEEEDISNKEEPLIYRFK